LDIASPIPKAHFETVLNMSPDAFATEAMGMRHCLPGKLAVSLREADSSRLRHIAAGTHDWVTTRVLAFLFGLFGGHPALRVVVLALIFSFAFGVVWLARACTHKSTMLIDALSPHKRRRSGHFLTAASIVGNLTHPATEWWRRGFHRCCASQGGVC
jgi:hypothetical protein